VVAWLRRIVRRFLPKIDKTYRQPAFLEAWWLVHEHLDDFEEQFGKYTRSDPEVRRAARLLLQREIERRRPGKADAVRTIALATVAPIALVGVGLWSDWSAALFAVLADSRDEPPTSSELSKLFAEALSPTIWAFIWVLLGLIFVLYVWAIATWGADKKRGTYVAWLAAYDEYEASERERLVSALQTEKPARPGLFQCLVGKGPSAGLRATR
jgi:hypothetical protein